MYAYACVRLSIYVCGLAVKSQTKQTMATIIPTAGA